MNNNKKAVKAGIGYTVSNYMLKGLGFLTIPIFTRLMSTANYGTFNTYAAYDSVLCIIIGMTLHSCFKSAKYKYGNKIKEFISSCILLSLFNLLAWLVIVNILYPVIGKSLQMNRLVVNVLLFNSIGNAIIHYYNSYVGLEFEYKSFLKIAALNSLSSIILSVILMITLCNNDRATGRILGSAIPVILIAIWIVNWFWKNGRPHINLEYWKYALKFSGPTIPHGLSQVVLSQFDRIMISCMCGNTQAGLYSFGYNIYTLMLVTANSLDSVWGPWLFERLHKKNYNSVRSVSGQYAFGILVFSCLIMMAAPEIIVILGTEEYNDAIYVVIPIVLGGFYSFLYTLPVQVEYYYEKTRYIALCSCGAAILNIILNWIFIPKYGYIAAAYTTVVTYLGYFMSHYIIAMKLSDGKLFNNIAMLGVVFISAASGMVALILINKMILRWIIIVLVILSYGFWMEKKYKLLKKAMNKLGY
mgnify:CR=1 FL=1